MSVTIREIVDDALGVISEVAGAGTETYEEDRMMKDAIRGFDLVFKKVFWPQYSKWFRLTLDGVLGIVTTDDLQNVKDLEDFSSVHRDGERRKLPRMSKSVNAYTITGTQLLFWDMLSFRDANYIKRRLQFYPQAATGLVNIYAREYPVGPNQVDGWREWDWEDTPLELDKDLLVYATAYASLSRDGLNDGYADTARTMMEQRYRDIRAAVANQPIAISSVGGVPLVWTDAWGIP